MRKAVILAVLLLSVLLPISNADSDFQRPRSTSTEFSYSGSADEVILRGEWDWVEETPLSLNNGVWSASLELQEGLYCYKFVVDDVWTLDPANSETTWCDGFENSLVRVDDKTKPKLSVESISIDNNSFSASIHYYGSTPDQVLATLDKGSGGISSTWNLADWSLDISANNLQDGKYRIRISASDEEQNLAEDLLLPFWIEEQKFQWDDAVIYMIMTDRYINGNTSNDPAPLSGAANGGDWLGGDIEGITSNLDNLAELGINTLWLSPLNQGPSHLEIAGDGEHQVAGYHGYWPTEPRSIDSRLGDEAQLNTLVDEAHSRGIRVMADMVLNHVHEDHPYYADNPEWFNQGCLCGSSDCDWTERRLDCLFMPYMPDIDWRNRNASEQFIADAIWWAEQFDFDGMRLDAVKHVDDNAINNIVARVSEKFEASGLQFFLKGETAMGWVDGSVADNREQYDTINRYMGEGGLDGQADFVLYHAVVDNVLTSADKGLIHLDHWTKQSQEEFTEGSIMVPYIGSHDVPRFISRADPDANGVWNQWQDLPTATSNNVAFQRWEMAMAWLLTIPGAPLIYAGDEHAMVGGADPDNRRMFDQSARDSDWVQYFAKARAELEPLRRGEYVQLTAEEEIMAFARQSEEEHVVVVLNRGGNRINLSTHQWLGNMSNYLGEVEWNGGDIEMDGASAAIFVQSKQAPCPPLTLEVENTTGELADALPKTIDVFGIKLLATSGVMDDTLLHAAGIMAGYLDNDGDGKPDDQSVVDAMVAANAMMFIPRNENEMEQLFDEIPESFLIKVDSGEYQIQDLREDEIRPGGKSGPGFDASLEEVLHLITHVGYASAYPALFSEVAGSELTNAMDLARGGHFEESNSDDCEDDGGQCAIPVQGYPQSAWYHYSDTTCDYSCMATEYLYWGLTTYMGVQSERCGWISEEWEACTRYQLSVLDERLFSLIEQSTLPRIAPDGEVCEALDEEDKDTLPDDNNTVPEENNTNSGNNTTVPVENNTGNETSVEAGSKSSGLIAESAKWVLVSLIGLVVMALFYTSRRRE